MRFIRTIVRAFLLGRIITFIRNRLSRSDTSRS